MGSPFHDQFFTHRKRNQACIFADNKQMKNIIFGSGFFHQVLMTESKRIGIHHKSSHPWCIFFLLRQSVQITGKTGTLIFHKDNLSIDPCNLIKAKIAEKSGRIAFRIKKQMCISSGKLQLDQMTDNRIHQSLALVFMADRHTPKRISKTASCCDQIHFIIIHPTGIIQISISADPLCRKQFIHQAVAAFI